jgi:hypothetical protein
MSYIACAENCLYQKDGCCTLDRVPDRRDAAVSSGCLYRVPLSDKNGGHGLANVPDGNELQS